MIQTNVSEDAKPSAARPAAKPKPARGRFALRRVKRLWTPVLQRLMSFKFPTVAAHLSAEQMEQIKSILEPGDILLKDDCSYPLSQFGARLMGSSWIHSAMFVGGEFAVDCGSKPYVAEIKLDEFLVASNVAVYRPLFKSKEDLDSALTFLRQSIGRPFNRSFNLSSRSSFYCTQLIFRALQQMPNPIDLHISTVGGKPAVLADDIENCKDLTLVYVSKIGSLKGSIAHAPSFFVLVAGALLGSKIRFGGAVLGSVLALASLLTLTEYRHQSNRRQALKNHES